MFNNSGGSRDKGIASYYEENVPAPQSRAIDPDTGRSIGTGQAGVYIRRFDAVSKLLTYKASNRRENPTLVSLGFDGEKFVMACNSSNADTLREIGRRLNLIFDVCNDRRSASKVAHELAKNTVRDETEASLKVHLNKVKAGLKGEDNARDPYIQSHLWNLFKETPQNKTIHTSRGKSVHAETAVMIHMLATNQAILWQISTGDLLSCKPCYNFATRHDAEEMLRGTHGQTYPGTYDPEIDHRYDAQFSDPKPILHPSDSESVVPGSSAYAMTPAELTASMNNMRFHDAATSSANFQNQADVYLPESRPVEHYFPHSTQVAQQTGGYNSSQFAHTDYTPGTTPAGSYPSSEAGWSNAATGSTPSHSPQSSYPTSYGYAQVSQWYGDQSPGHAQTIQPEGDTGERAHHRSGARYEDQVVETSYAKKQYRGR